MADALVAIMLTAIVLAIVIAVAVAVMTYVIPRLPVPIGQIVNIIMWGIIAILVVIYIFIPLVKLLPGTV